MKKTFLSLVALLATVGAWAITYPETGTEYIIKNFHGFVNNNSGYKSYMMSNSGGTVLERTKLLTADRLDACKWVFEKVDDENDHTFYLKNVAVNKYIYVENLIKSQNVTLSGENKSIIYLFDGNVAEYKGELFFGFKRS
jgi:TATA-box binding protein (TBP) (component of TFIID and TFIIIB)